MENEHASQEAPLLTNFTTRAVYAAIIDYFFQPSTIELKLLQYDFTKETSLQPPFRYQTYPSFFLLPFLVFSPAHGLRSSPETESLEQAMRFWKLSAMQNAIANIASPILPLFCNFQFLVCVSKLVVGKK